jgi:hypothetical protein
MNRGRIAVATAITTLALVGGVAMAPIASASTNAPTAKWNPISGTAGGFDNYICGDVTRHKTDYGNIKMSLNNAPVGELDVWLQNAKNGAIFAGPVSVVAGEGSPTLATQVLAGTNFHVCTASPAGADGGPYNGSIYY